MSGDNKGKDNLIIPFHWSRNLTINKDSAQYYGAFKADLQRIGSSLDLTHEINPGDMLQVRLQDGIRDPVSVRFLALCVYRCWNKYTGEKDDPQVMGVVIRPDGTAELPPLTLFGCVEFEHTGKSSILGFDRRCQLSKAELEGLMQRFQLHNTNYPNKACTKLTFNGAPSSNIGKTC